MPHQLPFDFVEITYDQLRDHPLFKTVKKNVLERFWEYHLLNPNVFELFTQYARQLKSAGREYYGAKAIIERIRWHLSVETRGSDFKMGNNHTSCYARLLVLNFPEEFDDFFEFRRSPGTVHMTHEAVVL